MSNTLSARIPSVAWAQAALLIAGTLLAGPSPAKAQTDQAAVVTVDAVVTQPLSQTTPVVGRLVARQTGVVAARTAGPVTEFLAQVGDRLKAGDVIAKLDTERLEWDLKLREAQVREAQARLNSARAQTRLAMGELERLEKLRKSSAFSPARFDDKSREVERAQSTAAEAEAALQSARASLESLKINLRDSHIAAPYPGVVSVKHTEVGSYVTVGAPVVTLIDDEHLEVEADVPSERIGGLDPGTQVTFTLVDGIARTARLRAVVPEENPRTRTRAVRFVPEFNGEAAQLATNQSLVLHIPIGKLRDVVTVHKDAILNRGGRQVLFLAEEGKAQLRPVELGDAVGDRFIVIKGVKPGDLAVIRGNERLRPTQAINPSPASKSAGAAGQ